MMFRRALSVAIAIALLVMAQGSASAAPDFYVLVVDQLSFRDILGPGLPSIRRLLDEGGVALMNTTTAGATTPENAAVTIGAGSRALGPTSTGQAFDRATVLALSTVLPAVSETFTPVALRLEQSQALPVTTTEQVYLRRTGTRLDGRIGNLSIIEIKSANRPLDHDAVPGSLGSALAASGIHICYFGNADTYVPKRHMTALFMDRQGAIAEGSVDVPMVDDPDSAFGVRMDYDYLAGVVDQGVAGSGASEADIRVVVFDVGDLARLYDANLSYTEEAVASMNRQIVKRLDALLGTVLQNSDSGDRVMLLVPTPARHEVAAGNTFAPVVLWQADGEGGGLLTSATTRRAGIVTNLDIAPTILAAFGVDVPDCVQGHELEVVRTQDSVSLVTALTERVIATNIQRRTILHPIITAYIVLYLSALLFVVLRPGFTWVQKALLVILPMMMSLPLALLIIPVFGAIEALPALGVSLVLALAASLIARHPVRHPLWPIGLISLATCVSILVDSYTGNHLIKNSVLGYDPMGGARFYGIGNEYMGVLVGSTIMCTSSLLDVFRQSELWIRRASVVLYVVVLLTIAMPTLGANVGGGITACVSLTITSLLLYRTKLTSRRVLLVMGLSVLIVGVSILFDLYLNPGGPSHLGKAVQMVDANGLVEVFRIARRKVLMNLKLFRYSVWSRAFVIALAVLAWLLYRPTQLIKRIRQEYPGAVIGLAGTIVGAVTALIVNDSGVVAGALVLHFATSTVLYLAVRFMPDLKEAANHSQGA